MKKVIILMTTLVITVSSIFTVKAIVNNNFAKMMKYQISEQSKKEKYPFKSIERELYGNVIIDKDLRDDSKNLIYNNTYKINYKGRYYDKLYSSNNIEVNKLNDGKISNNTPLNYGDTNFSDEKFIMPEDNDFIIKNPSIEILLNEDDYKIVRVILEDFEYFEGSNDDVEIMGQYEEQSETVNTDLNNMESERLEVEKPLYNKPESEAYSYIRENISKENTDNIIIRGKGDLRTNIERYYIDDFESGNWNIENMKWNNGKHYGNKHK
ncbi:hypothetical protein [Peptostreptococcus equinus]|uniref:Uncharacterized protein n=1 Tax=Peptostreptococcus equinus TaxID=3003601 RepID=A0ABY7JTA2_9FIRM|nr:hypothetical protein [Peptostreptococcus sp. CBA3647]WAW15152.1 hypothetical protein O0R46_01510 [Peptostreptococcus sp. CBA3647]